jgi:hypothetical protein
MGRLALATGALILTAVSGTTGLAASATPAWPQHDREWFSGALAAVVNERTQGVKSVASFERGCGVLLVRVRVQQGGVQIDDHRPVCADVVVGGMVAGQCPGGGPCLRAGGVHRGQDPVRVAGQGVHEPGDRGIGGDQSEQVWFGPQAGDVGQAVATQGQRDRQIAEDLGRVMDRGRTPPSG